MTLESLLNIHGKIDWRKESMGSVPTGLFFDSRQVGQGSVYVAIRGTSGDGHQYLEQAIGRGAIALIVEDGAFVPQDYQGVVVEVLDSRLTLQLLSQRFYGEPGENLMAIAITGTNGKTSTAYLVEYLLSLVGRLCGVIGTIDHHIGKTSWQTELTTPDPVTLQKRLHEFVEKGGDSFVIEASSHALSQNRINQGFDICLFTNLSRDHLDYHSNMEEYFQSKVKLFDKEMCKDDKDNFAILNGDDPYGKRLAQQVKNREVFLFGKNQENDFVFKVINQSLEGCEVVLSLPNGKQVQFMMPLTGEHNVYNMIGSLLCLYVMGYDLGESKFLEKIKKFPGIPGRVQSYKSEAGVYSFVDYAHTPEALEQVLLAIRSDLPKGQSLITVFGCGGDRDKGKRPMMGEVAMRLSDQVVVTSDNPRTEDPQLIINDIIKPLQKVNDNLIVEIDRAKAINKAVTLARPGDAILVAGKGHEDYQILGHNKVDFSDYQHLIQSFKNDEKL